MNWQGKKVFVSGAGGFIGSHLTEALLDRGAHVTALIHYNSRNSYGWLDGLSGLNGKNISFALGDIRDTITMRRLIKGQEVVFHLAALIGIPDSYMAPEAYVATNIKGTLNVLQAALEAKAGDGGTVTEAMIEEAVKEITPKPFVAMALKNLEPLKSK